MANNNSGDWLTLLTEGAKLVSEVVKLIRGIKKGKTDKEQKILEGKNAVEEANAKAQGQIAVSDAKAINEIAVHSAKKDTDLATLKAELDYKEEVRQRAAMFDLMMKQQQGKEDATSETEEGVEQGQEDLAKNDAVSPNEFANKARLDYSHRIDKILRQGGITLIAAPPKVGKTTLAFQIGVELASGVASSLMPSEKKSFTKQIVYIYDGELDEGDYCERYEGFNFPDGCLVITRDSSSFPFESIEKMLGNISIKVSALPSGSYATFVIDSLMSFGQHLQHSVATTLFNKLQKLQDIAKLRDIVITVILIDHFAEDRKYPLNTADLFGASTIVYRATKTLFFDNTSLGTDKKMLKVYYTRGGTKPEKVFLLQRVDKEDGNPNSFPHFEYIGEAEEVDVMPTVKAKTPSKAAHIDEKQSMSTREEKAERIRELAFTKQEDNPDKYLTQKQIAEKLGLSERTVSELYPEELRRKNRPKPEKK